MNNKELLNKGICPCCKEDADFQGYILHNMPMIFNGYCFEIEDMFDSGETFEGGSKFIGVYCPHCGAKFTCDGDIIEELSLSDVEKLWKKVIDGMSNVFVNENAKKEFFIEFLNYHKYNISNIINYVNKKHS